MVDFERIQKEVAEDVRVDELNIKEKQLQLPAIKHKWVSRLINWKREKQDLTRQKTQLVKAAVEQLSTSASVDTPKSVIEKQVLTSKTIIAIDEQIKDLEHGIEYLEKLESIFRNMTFDLKNVVELIRMETT